MDFNQTNILKTIKSMTAAFNNKDITGVLAAYEQDAAVMFEPGTSVSSKDALRQNFESMFQVNPKFTYPKGHEVYISNDIALHVAPWEMSGMAPDGSAIKQSGLSIAVLRKKPDGNWLMVLDHPNGQHLMSN
ncbi:hypothetical protein NBRC116188_14360 [Oceaniserpentilla sp. 4NH20-0058]|uniref:YybH family protein n=1 Tax=Oceaniserpentilla sp. 4NH20-0058 TaxID=3127660 RepID=UPI00310B756E